MAQGDPISKFSCAPPNSGSSLLVATAFSSSNGGLENYTHSRERGGFREGGGGRSIIILSKPKRSQNTACQAIKWIQFGPRNAAVWIFRDPISSSSSYTAKGYSTSTVNSRDIISTQQNNCTVY